MEDWWHKAYIRAHIIAKCSTIESYNVSYIELRKNKQLAVRSQRIKQSFTVATSKNSKNRKVQHDSSDGLSAGSHVLKSTADWLNFI